MDNSVYAKPATVTGIAKDTGGIAPGNVIEPDVDPVLLQLDYGDAPLMRILLGQGAVRVNSPEVRHFSMNRVETAVRTLSAVNATTQPQVILPIDPNQRQKVIPGSTMIVNGVNGYTEDGSQTTPGIPLMLYVVDFDSTTNNPVVRAINGQRSNPSDEFSTIPRIPANTTISVLAPAMYETQKNLLPQFALPEYKTVFLQKRGINRVVSDYLEAQRKGIPFDSVAAAEMAIRSFKAQGSRTLWASVPGKMVVSTELGQQYVYSASGLRWQFEKSLALGIREAWDFKRLMALAKLFFTGKDRPKAGYLFAGSALIEALHRVGEGENNGVSLERKKNSFGMDVTFMHTMFGDIEIIYEPTFDDLLWSNSGALVGTDRIVRYVYSDEHMFSDKIPGHEASREGVIVWDAAALKGSCNIWIDGEGTHYSGAQSLRFWDLPTVPDDDQAENKFYLLSDCPEISNEARAGQIWMGEKVKIGTGAGLKEVIRWYRLSNEGEMF
ncbi:MAG: hypothetical protein K2N21_01090 [Rikenellaceae bacterium]|nr:hypothetical protein [Rikenellaceae bacterium]